MTREQIEIIQEEKGRTNLSINYICAFEKRWNDVIDLLKKSKKDLAEIKIVRKKEVDD